MLTRSEDRAVDARRVLDGCRWFTATPQNVVEALCRRLIDAEEESARLRRLTETLARRLEDAGAIDRFVAEGCPHG